MRHEPAAPDNAGEIARMWRACELHDDGRALVTEEDIVAALQRPSMDRARDTVVVREHDAAVAFGLLYGERSVFANVLPSHRGQGIGAWLLRWSEDAGRAAGRSWSTQTVSEGEHAAIALLEEAGYERRWEEWLFEIELEREPDPPRLPPGYALRAFVPERDGRAAHAVIEAAFGEWPDPETESFEDWAAETLGRPGFMPEYIGTIVYGDEIVGVAVLVVEADEAWVSQLAVARPHRGLGLARALLVQAFATAWRLRRPCVSLATDGRTGARGLYEHVGMRVVRTAWEYAKPL